MHQQTIDYIVDAGRQLQGECHQASADAGWWGRNADPEGAGLPIDVQSVRSGSRLGKLLATQKLCLAHSELSEAMEGLRKDLQDDKLPHRKMFEVELADAAIRIFDLAGAMDFDLGAAIAEKMAYNAQRADHKPEARAAVGGKAF
jgi:NTP pyrophosphatase (non-canonical NTP hydrolase)